MSKTDARQVQVICGVAALGSFALLLAEVHLGNIGGVACFGIFAGLFLGIAATARPFAGTTSKDEQEEE